MTDTWEFFNASFPLHRFSQSELDKLYETCPSSLKVEGEDLIIQHLYIERRMTPLNLYLSAVDGQADETYRVLTDYGQAIKEIAGAGVFPGDLLLKNFGVSRQGRVIFYDYDEIVPMHTCVFRALSKARTPEQEMVTTPWYRVGKYDVFPEEFKHFLAVNDKLRNVFNHEHADLLHTDYWKSVQEKLAQGEFVNVYPYQNDSRYPQQTQEPNKP